MEMEKYIYRAKLERVVDGDTIDALIDVGFDIWVKKRIRYKGIDTWESRTRDLGLSHMVQVNTVEY
jgi:micrococcal nuclease